jgi:hypothetical protein
MNTKKYAVEALLKQYATAVMVSYHKDQPPTPTGIVRPKTNAQKAQDSLVCDTLWRVITGVVQENCDRPNPPSSEAIMALLWEETTNKALSMTGEEMPYYRAVQVVGREGLATVLGVVVGRLTA